MELSQSFEPKVRQRNTSKISLEEYLDFVDSHKQLDSTVHHLNQIIDMHGFKKIHKVPKKVLIDAVNSIDLMDSYRSTVEDSNNISSCAFINLEEIIKDVGDLKWQECCITSIQTVNSVNFDPPPKPMQKQKQKRQRKMRKLTAVTSGAAAAITVGDSDEPAAGGGLFVSVR